MARRFVVEISDEEYQKLLIMAKHARHSGDDRLKRYTWKEAAMDSLATGIEADWEYGSHENREALNG